MQIRLFIIMFLWVSVGFGFGGCTPWVKRAPSVDPEQPVQTLVTGAIVWVRRPGCDTEGNCDPKKVDLISVVSGLVDNSTLGEFGTEMVNRTEPMMKRYGFTLELDGARTKKLDTLQILELNNKATTVTGIWVHPQSAPVKFIHGTSSADADRLTTIAKALSSDRPQEAYVCFYLVVGEEGWLFEEPLLDLRITAMNQDGKEVFAARAIGEGNTSFWSADKSPANLKVALDDALQQLEGAELETLE